MASSRSLAFSFVVTDPDRQGDDAIIGLRVDEEAEDIGLDLAEHAEVGYSFSELSSMDRLGHTERVGHDDHADHLEEVR